MIYLASPYNHINPFVRAQRYLSALEAVALLLTQRKWVYSPIVHCHEIARNHGLPTGYDFWLDYDLHMLDRCEELYILDIDGWKTSIGVGAERKHAAKLTLPISLIQVVEGKLTFSPWYDTVG